MNPLLIGGILIFLYLLSLMRRAQLPAFSFILGSIGLFFILIAYSDPYWIWFFTHAVVKAVQGFGNLTGLCGVMSQYGIVHILTEQGSVLMSVDYECSGIIETMAFVALLTFFPAYRPAERLFYGAIGVLWIYLANVLRLCLVVVIVHFFGPSSFYLAHTILGRLLFYALVIILYYNVFTYSQMARGLYYRIRPDKEDESK
ncbi:exosortase family protein XrtG [Lapidilactobacillus salsurivasis]